MNVSYQNRLEQPQRRAADSKQKKTLGIAAWDNISGWLFISPMLIGFLLFMFGPLLFAFYISLTDWPLLGERAFAGLENYREIFGDPEFHQVLRNTIVFSGGLVPLNLALALSLALLMKDKIPGIGFFRTAIFVPVITSLVVWAIVWKFMFGPELGLINQMLGFIGIDGPNWLYDKRTAMPAVIATSVLKNVGLNMILFIAALQQVPKSLYESAMLDGANGAQRFWRITVPYITPTIFLTAVITVIGSMKIFAQIFVMTNGGPENSTKVLVFYIWEQAFRLYELGYASALAFILFFIILAFTLLQWHFRKRWVFHEQ